ncbi:hypothetical protein [uncultured Roseibium sp.]|uniref:hypothetical protein n=1 Tax=uncultured Roseibium sp. TaxID=1936171 RepID=UPI0026160194|nr:hypothetical protein [uncultured Roseibium sp.]
MNEKELHVAIFVAEDDPEQLITDVVTFEAREDLKSSIPALLKRANAENKRILFPPRVHLS